MQTVSNNKVNTLLEQSVVLGALDVIVIEWSWLLHFVLHMHSIVRNIVLKSISWLHILNRKNIINAFECNWNKMMQIFHRILFTYMKSMRIQCNTKISTCICKGKRYSVVIVGLCSISMEAFPRKTNQTILPQITVV